MRLFPERVIRVNFRDLVRDTVLCSLPRHSTLTVSLSTQEYKWVPANCWGNLTNCREVTCDGLASRPGGVEILLAASCYRNQDKLRQPVLAPRLHFFLCLCDLVLVQLWTVNNYHWYLKQHIEFPASLKNRVACLIWDPEVPLRLHIMTRGG